MRLIDADALNEKLSAKADETLHWLEGSTDEERKEREIEAIGIWKGISATFNAMMSLPEIFVEIKRRNENE